MYLLSFLCWKLSLLKKEKELTEGLLETQYKITENEKRRKEIKYVFAIYDGVIQETYNVLDWFPGGSTYSVREDKEEWKKHERWEFIGNISNEMRKKYLHKSVDHYWKQHSQNPVRYTF